MFGIRKWKRSYATDVRDAIEFYNTAVREVLDIYEELKNPKIPYMRRKILLRKRREWQEEKESWAATLKQYGVSNDDLPKYKRYKPARQYIICK